MTLPLAEFRRPIARAYGRVDAFLLRPWVQCALFVAALSVSWLFLLCGEAHS